MHWLLLTIISAVFASLARILQKSLLDDPKSNTYALAFVFQVLVGCLFLVYTAITKTFEFPSLNGLSSNLIMMVLFYSLGNALTFKAFKIAEASEVSIVLASSTVWSVISAITYLNEKITLSNIVGIALIASAVIAINYTNSHWKLNRGHLYALLGALLYGLAFTNDAYIVERYSSIASYMALAYLLPGLAMSLYSPKLVLAVPHFFGRKHVLKLLACCLFSAFCAIAIFSAYKSGGQASIISPIQQTSLILTVVLSFIFLKERSRVTNKVIGTLLAFIGVLLLI